MFNHFDKEKYANDAIQFFYGDKEPYEIDKLEKLRFEIQAILHDLQFEFITRQLVQNLKIRVQQIVENHSDLNFLEITDVYNDNPISIIVKFQFKDDAQYYELRIRLS
jgi:hypothetical protein